MAKIKIFKFVPENAKEITELIQSVRILQEGLLISDGHLGIMYKEIGDVGMDKEEMVNPISGELAKSQKQFLLQTGLVRGYEALENKFTAIREAKKTEMDEANVKLTAHKELKTFVPVELSDDIEAKQKRLAEIKKLFTQKKNGILEPEKEKLLKEAQAIEEALKPLVKEAGEKQEAYEAETAKLQHVVSEANVAMVNASGKAKENREKKEQAIEDRDEAMIFIEVAMKFIGDIQAGTLEKDSGLLKLKS